MVSMENISDEIIFDYLEGNMLPQEKEAFELRINASETLEYEVRIWRQSYLTADELPDTRKLEARLHLPGAARNYLERSASRFLMLVLLVFLSADPFHIVNLTSSRVPPKPLQETSQQVMVVPASEIHPVTSRQFARTASTSNHSQLMPGPRVVISGAVSTKTFNPQRMEVKPVPGRTLEVTVTPVNTSTSFQQPPSQKKKMPARSRPLFQKGRVPYVVPLKSNDF